VSSQSVIFQTTVRIDLTMLPLDCIDSDIWHISVEWRDHPDRYGVVQGSRCLTPDGVWHIEQRGRDRDCARYHRYGLDEALALAREHLPFLTVNGLTSLQVLERLAGEQAQA
jgi:hypothetical protein